MYFSDKIEKIKYQLKLNIAKISITYWNILKIFYIIKFDINCFPVIPTHAASSRIKEEIKLARIEFFEDSTMFPK